MAVFKCKICGGDLEVQEGMSVCECEYCGTKQTLPKMKDDRRANLYDRANHFRRNNEFDKAMGMYEQILQEDREDAEAYWSLVLCTYGIEYVEDPTTHTRKPTVNRTQYTSVFADENYKAALKYADDAQRQIYEEEAKQIDGIQKEILDISSKEEPFDVFICYKETDAAGKRTQDSVLANDLYHQLTEEGFKVFFARITLEDKLGSAYEPYIFAALNSARVMVVLGTRPEYFNAVWVRNEWSRYLSLIKSDAKKVLIPAYKDMDPYELPQEFSHLQSQDMGKLGFMQDLIRGVRKLIGADEKTQSAAFGGPTALLKRAFLFLEDGDFTKADEYCERVLNLDPENGEAYLGKLMVLCKVRRREELSQCAGRLDAADAFRKVMRFGGESLRKEAEGYNQQIINRLNEEEEKQREQAYQGALQLLNSAVKSSQLKDAIARLQKLGEYKDVADRIKTAEEKLAQFEKKERAQRTKKRIMVVAIVAVVVMIGLAIIRNYQLNQAWQAAYDLVQEERYETAYWKFSELLGLEQAKEETVSVIHSVVADYLDDGKAWEAYRVFFSQPQYFRSYSQEVIWFGNVVYHKARWHVLREEYDGITDMLHMVEDLPYSTSWSEAATEFRNAMYQKAQQHVSTGEYDKIMSMLFMIEALPDSESRLEAATEFGNAVYPKVKECVKSEDYDTIDKLFSRIGLYQDSDWGVSEEAIRIREIIYQTVLQCLKDDGFDDAAEKVRSLMK